MKTTDVPGNDSGSNADAPEGSSGPRSENDVCFISPEARAEFVDRRIRGKMDDYARYDFSPSQVRALNIFFDLSQEFRGRELFYDTCLYIPRIMFGLESCLYVLEDEDTFVLAARSSGFGEELPNMRGWDEQVGPNVAHSEGYLFLPVRCNPDYNDLLPFLPPDNIIGNFVFKTGPDLSDSDRLFMEKYVNRVGFQLHNRLLRDRNREHLGFIRNLVEDIGHNVIVPNMYFKLYFNQLRRMINSLKTVSADMRKLGREKLEPDCADCADRLHEVHGNMKEKFDEIYRHYVQTSMFLETLLRRRHFEEGRYVLEKRPCNLRSQVVEPQLSRYMPRLEERGVELDMTLGGAPPDQVIRIVVDIGLLSQVFANLFSNAVKYTRQATLPDGRTGRFMSYGWKLVKNHFSTGVDGIRMYVFTTGKPLSLLDPMEVFQAGFRAMNEPDEAGTGHGLFFVRQVVELHRGEVGYAAREYGNEFYFILPLELEGAPSPVLPPRCPDPSR